MNRAERRRQQSLQRKGQRAGSVGDRQEAFVSALQLHQAGRLTDAQQLYEQILTAEPRHADALHLLGLASHQLGDNEAAVDLIQRAIAINPNTAEVHGNLGDTLKDLGRLDEAAAAYNQALAINPEFAEVLSSLGVVLKRQDRLDEAVAAHRRALELNSKSAPVQNDLGNALKAQGNLKEAVTCYQQAVAIDPAYAAAYCNLGVALQMQGKYDEAGAAYEKALAIYPSFAEVHSNYGTLLQNQGKLDDAVSAYQRALELNPDLAGVHTNLGDTLERLGKLNDAVAAYRTAIRLEPDNTLGWQRFAQGLRNVSIAQTDALLGDELVHCLSLEGVDYQDLAQAGVSVLARSGPFQHLLGLVRDRQSEELGVRVRDSSILGTLNAPLLLELLEKVVVKDADFEALLTTVRKSLLSIAAGPKQGEMIAAAWLPFLSALAHQCFNNEYVYYQTPDETQWCEQLRDRVERTESAEKIPKCLIALLASYRPLYELKCAEAILDVVAWDTDDSFHRLLRRQLLEPLEESAIRKVIPKLMPITDPVSKRVRAQYEENPYPRWISHRYLEPKPFQGVIKQLFPYLPDASIPDRGAPAILVAGCGSGKQPVLSARRFIGAEVLAVDLSLASLAYGMRKARELRVSNIEFAQADVLELGGLGRQFDLIECFGVLHHLDDPLEGWRVLTDLLKADGYMMVGLYSEMARRDVVAARALITDRGYQASLDGIRQCRREILALPDDAPLKSVTGPSSDFWTTSECRDFLFHVKEHRFTVAQIREMLEQLKLTFLGFECQGPWDKARYLAAYPEDPSATSLIHWQAFEAAHPAIFEHTYRFWVKKC